MMFNWIKNWINGNRDPDGMIQHDLSTGKTSLVKDTPAGKLYEFMFKEEPGQCPECLSKEGFWEGPSGGVSTNIFCTKCGVGFNVTPIIRIAECIPGIVGKVKEKK